MGPSRSGYSSWNSRAIQDLLPALYEASLDRHRSLDDLLSMFTQASQLLRSPLPVRRDVLEGVYLDVMIAVQGHNPAKEASAHLYLTGQLDKRLKRELARRPLRDPDRSGAVTALPQTLQYFRCLADVSNHMHSKALGTALSSFFMQRAQRILDEERSRGLVHWCTAMMHAWMSPGEQIGCLKTM